MAKLHNLKPRITSEPAKRIATHTAGAWREDKTSSAQRGYGHKWRVARAAYLLKHPYCVFCLRDAGIPNSDDHVAVGMACARKGIPIPIATVVDHSVPHRGDMKIFWDSSLWISLCRFHHNGEAQERDRLL